MSAGDFFLALLAILFPPIAVWIKRGLCSADSLINIVLCVLGYVPGLLHAWYIIAQYPEEQGYAPISDGGEGGSNNGNGQVYYVVHAPPQANGRQQGHNKSYGTNPARRPAQDSQSPAQPSQNQAGPSQESMAPPPYEDAIKGDHKVQHS